VKPSASSRSEKRRGRKGDDKKKLSNKQKLALENPVKLPDSEIDLSDPPERLDWSDAERGKFYRPVKQSVTMRVDADVLEWFKSNSEKYQSRINQVLREFVQQERKARGAKR
jgi:uncharacterized protein (DUF4415 family)